MDEGGKWMKGAGGWMGGMSFSVCLPVCMPTSLHVQLFVLLSVSACLQPACISVCQTVLVSVANLYCLTACLQGFTVSQPFAIYPKSCMCIHRVNVVELLA